MWSWYLQLNVLFPNPIMEYILYSLRAHILAYSLRLEVGWSYQHIRHHQDGFLQDILRYVCGGVGVVAGVGVGNRVIGGSSFVFAAPNVSMAWGVGVLTNILPGALYNLDQDQVLGLGSELGLGLHYRPLQPWKNLCATIPSQLVFFLAFITRSRAIWALKPGNMPPPLPVR
jgi:hypothetical protein